MRLSEGALNNCLSTLPAFLGEKILRYRRWEDRQAVLVGKLLLREVLAKRGYAPDCLERLRFDSYGRPHLEENVDFNISHSGEFVLCAVASGGRVGVDVERVRDLDISQFHKYFSAESWQEITASENRPQSFFDHWTMRESVIKADGRGLSIPLKKLHVEEGAVALDGKNWFLKKLDLAPGYSCHLATDGKNPEINMRIGNSL